MGEELQKQNAEIVTFQKRPQEFLEFIARSLDTFQKVYRTKLPDEELIIWRETLKDYSVAEFAAAMSDLISNPPKYELEDGTIQVWRGMPKLPDVVNVMLDLREKSAAEYRRKESERDREEMAVLEKRRAEHPEEFIGMKELAEIAQKLQGGVKRMPEQKREYADLDFDKNAETLRRQADKLRGGA
jgi:hypothetical protein